MWNSRLWITLSATCILATTYFLRFEIWGAYLLFADSTHASELSSRRVEHLWMAHSGRLLTANRRDASDLFREYQSVDDGGARALGRYFPDVTLFVRSISPSVAAILAKHHGVLELNELEEISDGAADALAQHKGTLSLRKLKSLPASPGHNALASKLARQHGELHLNELTTLSDSAAFELAACQGTLFLDKCGDVTISESSTSGYVALAVTLRKLSHLVTISKERAAELASYSKPLMLDGLTTISDAVATELAKHRGASLSLNGVKSLTDNSASQLATYPNHLSVDALTELPDRSGHLALVAKLSEQKEPLKLNHIRVLSDRAASKLAEHQAELSLNGLTTLDDVPGHIALARKLARQVGQIELNNVQSISENAMAELAKHKGGISLNGLQTISGTLASAMMNHTGELSIHGVTSLSDEVALILAKHRGRITLRPHPEGIDFKLSDTPRWSEVVDLDSIPSSSHIGKIALAVKLSHNEMTLRLSKLTLLSDEAALELAAFKGTLYLDGLQHLSDSAAERISHHKGVLFFCPPVSRDTIIRLAESGLADLSDSAAHYLSRHEGDVVLNNLKELRDSQGHIELAGKLAQQDELLFLNGMTSVSELSAAKLAQRKGLITCDSLSELRDTPGHIAFAAKLATQPGHLSLPRLTKVSSKAAAELAKHQGDLNLSGLTDLPDSPGHIALAAKLAQVKDRLTLDGLTTLSDKVAAELCKHQGSLSLNSLSTLSDDVAAKLVAHNGDVFLEGLRELTTSRWHVALAAKMATQFGTLELTKLRVVSDAAAAELARHPGEVWLTNLEELTEKSGHVALATKLGTQSSLPYYRLQRLSAFAASKLVGRQKELSLPDLEDLTDSPDHIALSVELAKTRGWLELGSTVLSDIAARELAKHQGPLTLDGLAELSDSAAGDFASHVGDLSVDGLRTLSDEAVRKLAKHKGTLSLNGIADLSVAAAAALATHEGDLCLDGLKTLSDEATRVLGKHQGTLSLNGIADLSDLAAAGIATHQGGLSLDGLKTLSDAAARELSGHRGALSLRSLNAVSKAALAILDGHTGPLTLNRGVRSTGHKIPATSGSTNDKTSE